MFDPAWPGCDSFTGPLRISLLRVSFRCIRCMKNASERWKYTGSRYEKGATPFFFDMIKQRNHKYATHSPANQFYVFLATAPTGVLTAGTAEIR